MPTFPALPEDGFDFWKAPFEMNDLQRERLKTTIFWPFKRWRFDKAAARIQKCYRRHLKWKRRKERSALRCVDHPTLSEPAWLWATVGPNGCA